MGNFSKTKSIILYCVFGLIFIFGTILSFVPMNFGTKDFLSSFGALKSSNETGNTITAIYSYTESESTDLDKAIKMIGEKVEAKFGKNCVNVSKFGNNQLKVEVSEPIEQTTQEEVESFFTTLAGGRLEFRNNKSATITSEEIGEGSTPLIVIDGWTEIKSISEATYKGNYGLTIEFTKSGKTKFASMAGQTLYMFINGEAFPSSNANSVEISSEQTTFTVWFGESLTATDYYYDAFSCGLIPINLDKDNIEVIYYNSNDTAYLYTCIAVLSLVAILAIITIAMFRLQGLLFALATLTGDYLLLFLVQAMPWTSMGIAGLLTLGFVQLVQFSLIIANLRQVKKEYLLGKSIVTSIEDAFNKFRSIVLDVCAVMLISGIFFALFGTLEFTSIGTILALSAIIIAFVNIIYGRILISLSFAFCENKPSAFGLPKREVA